MRITRTSILTFGATLAIALGAVMALGAIVACIVVAHS